MRKERIGKEAAQRIWDEMRASILIAARCPYINMNEIFGNRKSMTADEFLRIFVPKIKEADI